MANQFEGFFTFDLFELLILIMGVHCYIVLVNALKEENKLLKSKVLNVEHRLSQSEARINSLDQYNQRNDLEIQGIPSNVSDDTLEDKVIVIFDSLNISVSKNEIEDCHRLGKADPKNTTV